MGTDRFEQCVDEFMEGILARLESQSIEDHELRDLWEEIREERKDPRLAQWRKVEAILGYDAGEAPEELMTAVGDASKVYGRRAVEEIAADRMKDTSSRISLLQEVQKRKLPAVVIPHREDKREVNTGIRC